MQLKKDEEKIYSVTLEEDVQVRNLKPAVVKVYDYYQTSKNLIKFLNMKFYVLFLFYSNGFLIMFAGDEAVTDYTSPCAESM